MKEEFTGICIKAKLNSYSWREEVMAEIPILRDVNKNAQEAINEEGTSGSDSEDD